MRTNLHTHTSFCDGKNTPEEMVLSAIEKGFSSIGFSGHGYTPFDLRYCMKDTAGYIKEITALKEKYKKDIEIYCGVEEDSFSYTNRGDFDYIIGSSHYIFKNGEYYPIDSSYDHFKRCLEVFEGDALALAEDYYSAFVGYILKRKPDIVGHFDVITKYDEIDESRFLTSDEYQKISEKYIRLASQADVIFEINTGAMARGARKTPYLGERLLSILKKEGKKVTLSSDSHAVDTLDFGFDEMIALLKEVGFDSVYELRGGEFKKRFI